MKPRSNTGTPETARKQLAAVLSIQCADLRSVYEAETRTLGHSARGIDVLRSESAALADHEQALDDLKFVVAQLLAMNRNACETLKALRRALDDTIRHHRASELRRARLDREPPTTPRVRGPQDEGEPR